MKPLGRTERKILLVVELHRRLNGCGPSWGRLAEVVDVDRVKLVRVVFGLRTKGLVDFTEEAGSIAATPLGVRVAVHTKAEL